MNKLTAEKCREQFEEWTKSFGQEPDLTRANGGANYADSAIDVAWLAWKASRQALEIALPVLEQQESEASMSNNEGLTEADRYKIPALPEMVSAQDMRETLNFLMHEEEAQAAATGFNQCLMECAPIYEAALRKSRCIDECLKELDAMQESINHTHKRRTIWRERAEAAEAKLAALDTQPQPSTPQIDNDGWVEWGGGERPVEVGTLVEFEMRDGDKDTALSTVLDWPHENRSDDIIAYRVIDQERERGEE